MSIATRIHEQRRSQGLTQEQLAARCEPQVKQSDISRWERGESPQADSLLLLADALGVTIRWLITGADPPAADDTAAA